MLLILNLRNKRFTQGKPSERIIHMYAYSEKLLGVIKLYRQDMNYTAYADFIEKALAKQYFNSGEFRNLVYSALECSFGNGNPDNASLDSAIEFTEKLSRNIYTKSGKFKKLLLKFIFVYI